MENKIRYYKQNGEEYSFSKEPQIKITQTSNADMNIGIPKKQTAVDWLVEQLATQNGSFHAIAFYNDNKYIIDQAKEMEKHQIKNAYLEGESDAEHLIDSDENYYQETYAIGH
jgi:hypothetical protein